MSAVNAIPGHALSGAALVVAALGTACVMTPIRPAPQPAPVTPAQPSHPQPEPPAPSPPAIRVLDRAPLPPANPALPPVPKVTGPLSIKVVYPPRDALIGSRDSNFVFGSIGDGSAALTVNGTLVPVWPNGAFMGWVANPPADSQYYDLVAYTLSDTVRERYPVRTREAITPPPETREPEVARFRPALVATLRDRSPDGTVSDTDDVIIGRPTPRGDYKWFLFPGTTVRVLEYSGGMAQVELDAGQKIWVDRHNLQARHTRKSAPRLRVTRASMTATAASVDLSLRVASPPAYVVAEGDSSLTLTLYNTTTSAILRKTKDPFLVRTAQSHTRTRTIYRLALASPVYGYQVIYAKGTFKLVIRRPPVTDAAAPLRGMTIVVDPGHPPIGATGPTGLWEPVPTLAVGFRVRDLLQARGATVIMTRTTADPVALGDRPILARRVNANAFVSIHLNADADGQNPFRDNGTGTYYFHPHSRRLAHLVQDALVPQLGLHDRGIFYQNLAVCRPTWFPAVLAEGLFIIMPDQEAAIKTPEYQEAYARGIVNGLEQYFATFAH